MLASAACATKEALHWQQQLRGRAEQRRTRIAVLHERLTQLVQGGCGTHAQYAIAPQTDAAHLAYRLHVDK